MSATAVEQPSGQEGDHANEAGSPGIVAVGARGRVTRDAGEDGRTRVTEDASDRERSTSTLHVPQPREMTGERGKTHPSFDFFVQIAMSLPLPRERDESPGSRERQVKRRLKQMRERFSQRLDELGLRDGLTTGCDKSSPKAGT
jgi:hypothetical protein